jgi:hypothetical protein
MRLTSASWLTIARGRSLGSILAVLRSSGVANDAARVQSLCHSPDLRAL